MDLTWRPPWLARGGGSLRGGARQALPDCAWGAKTCGNAIVMQIAVDIYEQMRGGALLFYLREVKLDAGIAGVCPL